MAFYAAAAGVGVVASVSYAATGFGPAIMTHVCWNACWVLAPGFFSNEGDLVQLVSTYRVYMLVTFVLMYKDFKTVDWPLLCCLAPPQFVAHIIGVNILVSSPPAILRRSLGVMLLSFAVFKASLDLDLPARLRRRFCASSYGEFRDDDLVIPGEGMEELEENGHVGAPSREADPRSAEARGFRERVRAWSANSTITGARMAAMAVCFGGLSGLCSGIFGVGGPPLMIFVMLAQLDKGQIRSTTVAMTTFTYPPEAVYLLFVKKTFRADLYLVYLCTVGGGLVGLFIGVLIHERVNTEAVMWGILSLLMAAALVMLDAPLYVVLLVGSVPVVTMGAVELVRRFRRKQQDEVGALAGGDGLELAEEEHLAADGSLSTAGSQQEDETGG